MTLLGVSLDVLAPAFLALYALAFISGGIYYLEQRVARIRDLVPERRRVAWLVGYATLAIGLLAALAVGGILIAGGGEYRLGGLVAIAAGAAYWIFRIYLDLTAAEQVRDILLALICAVLTVIYGLWVQSF